MSDPCATCAFRQGSVTHDAEPRNRLKGMICASAGIPFYCHCGWDWRNIDVFLIHGQLVTIGGELDPRRLRVCAGWKKEVARLAKQGGFDVPPEVRTIQKLLGQAALRKLREFVDAPEGAEKDVLLRQLREFTEMVMQKPEHGVRE